MTEEEKRKEFEAMEQYKARIDADGAIAREISQKIEGEITKEEIAKKFNPIIRAALGLS